MLTAGVLESPKCSRKPPLRAALGLLHLLQDSSVYLSGLCLLQKPGVSKEQNQLQEQGTERSSVNGTQAHQQKGSINTPRTIESEALFTGLALFLLQLAGRKLKVPALVTKRLPAGRGKATFVVAGLGRDTLGSCHPYVGGRMPSGRLPIGHMPVMTAPSTRGCSCPVTRTALLFVTGLKQEWPPASAALEVGRSDTPLSTQEDGREGTRGRTGRAGGGTS